MTRRRPPCIARLLPSPAAAAAALAIVVSAAAGTGSALGPDDVTDEHVGKAIDAIVLELYARKGRRHSWDPLQWGPEHGSKYQTNGYTALTVLSLLHAGQSYQDPRLRGAINRLTRAKMVGTYAVAIRTAVWAKLPPKFHEQLETDTRWLLDGFSAQAGGWTYQHRPTTVREDNSIRQYGALALWEAGKRGLAIPPRYWQRLEDAFIQCQLPDGGWNYKADDAPATGSMTTAGLATIFITQDLLHAEEAVNLRRRKPAPHAEAISRGLAWMSANFTAETNPGSYRDVYYYLYGVERVGLASGRKYFGSHDWFREGAAQIIARLCAWDEVTRTMTAYERVGGRGSAALIRTRHLAFAVMFLTRGRVPIALNKLETPGTAWNNRPRDCANVAGWLTRASETDLSWQIASLDAPPEDWLDAPMLYLASNRAIPWAVVTEVRPRRLRRDVREHRLAQARGEVPMTAERPGPALEGAAAKIKRYLDLGGLLVAVNEGNSRSFAASIETLGTVLYPEYDWRMLPDDHWAYTIHDQVKAGRPALKALSNGVRELIVLSPAGDLAATFQRGPDRAASPADHARLATAGNLYLYASELNRPRPRLAEHVYAADPGDRPARTVTVVRAVHEGNWNPEPAALGVFTAYLAREHAIRLRLRAAPLRAIHEIEPPPALVVVSGTEPIAFADAERASIRRYVTDGGTILFEDPGGGGRFTAGAEQMATALFPAPIQSLLRHAIVTGHGLDGANDLSRLEYRPYSFQTFGSRETTPRLRGSAVNGSVRMLFSREDLSHALLDQPRWGISGYASDGARRLLANIVRYAAAEGTNELAP